MTTKIEYDVDIQKLLLSYMISDSTSFSISQNIIKPEYFEDKLRPVARYILEFSDEYKTLPTTEQIKATTKVSIDKFDQITPQYSDWYLSTIEDFCRHKALELAVLDGVDLLQKGQGAALEQKIKDAMTISLMSDLGLNYFKNPEERLEKMKDKSKFVSTGWSIIDKKLYGGFTRGALNVFAGGSGSGKSLFLQNLCLNWVFMGLNVIYITLELSEELVAMRLDSMVSGKSTTDVMKNTKDTALTVSMKSFNAGTLTVKKLPEAGTTSNDLRAYLKQYEIETGIRPEAVVVDYLDLMHPNNRKINPSDLFIKDKFVSEELRALAGEYNLLFATASQLNRQSVDAQEFDHSHIAGGISKINTSDNVFGIFTSTTMKERGEYQLQFLKTRSSSAVGQKIILGYDPVCMRITDKDDYIDEEHSSNNVESIKDKINSKNKTTSLDTSIPSQKDIEDMKVTARDNLMDLIQKTRNTNDR